MKAERWAYLRGVVNGFLLAVVFTAALLFVYYGEIKEAHIREGLNQDSIQRIADERAHESFVRYYARLADPEYRAGIEELATHFDLPQLMRSLVLHYDKTEKVFTASPIEWRQPWSDAIRLTPVELTKYWNLSPSMTATGFEQALAARYRGWYRSEFSKERLRDPECGTMVTVFVSEFHTGKFGYHMSAAFEAGGTPFLVEVNLDDRKLAMQKLQDIHTARIKDRPQG